jgi:betaine-homocysteine S-methyltransferase
VPYRTTEAQPTFFNLDDNHGCQCPAPHGRTFPTALDPLYCNRYEIRDFAERCLAAGIEYVGVCCGATPVHIREVAEACGRVPPASRYGERMQNHFMYGSNERIPRIKRGWRLAWLACVGRRWKFHACRQSPY